MRERRMTTSERARADAMVATHRCAACDGSGIPDGFTLGGRYVAPHGVCLVCHGARSLPDRMPAADAMADAETLWLVVRTTEGFSREFNCWTVSQHGVCLRDARDFAYLAINGARDFAFERACNAAHAAFRAVPGLRG
jgi:hypothetical protein